MQIDLARGCRITPRDDSELVTPAFFDHRVEPGRVTAHPDVQVQDARGKTAGRCPDIGGSWATGMARCATLVGSRGKKELGINFGLDYRLS